MHFFVLVIQISLQMLKFPRNHFPVFPIFTRPGTLLSCLPKYKSVDYNHNRMYLRFSESMNIVNIVQF